MSETTAKARKLVNETSEALISAAQKMEGLANLVAEKERELICVVEATSVLLLGRAKKEKKEDMPAIYVREHLAEEGKWEWCIRFPPTIGGDVVIGPPGMVPGAEPNKCAYPGGAPVRWRKYEPV